MLRNIKAKIASKVSLTLMGLIGMISIAAATITDDLANFSTIIGNSSTGFTSFFVNMMTIFMEPPLVYFVVLGIFVTFLGLVAGFLLRRGKK